MKLSVRSFRGEAPRITPRELPPNAAQEATNCRLQTGDLEAWRHFLLEKTLSHPAGVQTIYLLKDKWLSWPEQVDVARGVIEGDTTYRTYLTCPSKYGKPQFTNYAMATTGAEPFPVATRPLGVPSPDTAPTVTPGVDSTPTTYSVDETDDGTVLATKWSTNPPLSLLGGSRFAETTQGSGYYQTKYDENRDPGQECYAFRSFGVAGATVLQMRADVSFHGDTAYRQAVLIAGATAAGAGVGVRYDNGVLTIRKTAQWGAQFYGADAASVVVTPALAGATVYSLRLAISLNADGSKTVTASVWNAAGTTKLAEVVATNIFTDGDYCGFANGASADSASRYETHYDNFRVQASGSSGYVPTNIATSYVYRFVNDLGEPSAPSPQSRTVLRPDGVSVTVDTPTTTPLGTDPAYGITLKQIYRAVTGANGTVFVFVGEIPLATATFVDDLDDSEIADNEVLDSDEWDLPPDDLEGILALPNAVMCGFRRNQLCFSVAGRPHAWRVRDRKTTDVDIVAIANIDTTVVVGTKSHVYTATGTASSSYTMSKPGAPQACTSKRGMLFVDKVGVLFPSPDGWMVCRGSAGQVDNASEGIFTRRQWQALDPTSIIAAAHDGVLFWWSTGQTPDSGYALDVKPTGFGLIRLGFHAAAAHVDPLEDQLYVTLDAFNEPTDPSLPVPPTFAPANAHTIYAFDANPASDMVYRWRGRLNLMPFPLSLTIAQVRALSFSNLLFRVYADGVQILERVITNAREFTLPYLSFPAAETYELEIMGTSTARTMEAAEDVLELE